MSSVSVPRAVRTAKVRDLARGEEREWDDFVQRSPYGTFFHLSGWKTVVEDVLGHRSQFFLACDERGIRGVLPASLVRSRLFGSSLVSLPLTVYGGACANDEEAHAGLLEAARDAGRQLGVQYVELRNRFEPYGSTLPGRDLYVTFTRDLTPGPDALMKGLPRDTRYAIRKSLKAGLDWADNVGLPEFYAVYSQNVHHLGTPVFSQKLFLRLQEVFGKQCRIFGVRKGARLIAAVMCFYFRDQVLPYYAGALPEYFADSPNNFMYWKLICQSCDEGFRMFDFGRSKQGTGSFQFKASWAMDITPLPYRYDLIRAKDVPHMSPVDGKFRLATSLWKKLPLKVATRLGPCVIQLVPSV
jgi:FemAB-related protein (PEP-CTERM system-associated)